MIGVIANASESATVCEFFELFKTPWEWYRSDRHYEVLVCDKDSEVPDPNAELVVVYGGRTRTLDTHPKIETVTQTRPPRMLRYKENRIPIYGECLTFPEHTSVLTDEETCESVICLRHSRAGTLARIGYDLFGEVHTLLTEGQPAYNADFPSLELHIALLRDLIVTSRVPLVEIPPVPAGYRFIACLTHDVDHPSVRRHKLDHTMFGFLYRAVLGSLSRMCRGRLPARSLLRNWAAAVKLPLVYLGLAKDFWYELDRYVSLEKGLHSTFFVIPFANRPGRVIGGSAPNPRAARYGISDIPVKIRELMSGGCEIGLHGIDAWLDSSSAQAELAMVRRVTGRHTTGARMHWLYFGRQSPAALDQAGADYDSSVGYNETVGYRAGTTQAYKPFGVTQLLELPLHIMDTALFFPSHLDLSSDDARKRVRRIVDNAVQFGGTVTVNWHDRSIAPERCWGDFYVELIQELESKGAWFATAAETIAWFRKRRSSVFETARSEWDMPHIKTTAGGPEGLPALQLRVHDVRQRRTELA